MSRTHAARRPNLEALEGRLSLSGGMINRPFGTLGGPLGVPALAISPSFGGPTDAVGIPSTAQVNHGDYLPGADGACNSKQSTAARFANGMLGGTVPLSYG